MSFSSIGFSFAIFQFGSFMKPANTSQQQSE